MMAKVLEVETQDEDVKEALIDGVMIGHSPEKTRHEDVFGFLFPLMRIFEHPNKASKGFGIPWRRCIWGDVGR